MIITLYGLGCSGGGSEEKELDPLISQLACIDTLAGVHYPELLQHIPNHIGVGFFHYAFEGDVPALVVSEFEKGRKHIRINILWKDDHEYTSDDAIPIIEAVEKYEQICQRFPEAKLQLSPITEHNLPNPELYLQLIKDHAPSCGKPVNSILHGGYIASPEIENEVHNYTNCPTSGICSWSSDGEDAFKMDFAAVRQANTHAVRLCVWHPRLNLRYIVNDPAPRWQRIEEANERKPSLELINNLVNLVG